MEISIEKPLYIITYSNHLEFNNRTLAFRNKELFDITGIPSHIPFNLNDRYWSVKGKQLTISKAQELIKKEPKEVDVTDLQ
jgi:hypothetical protein